MSQRRLDALRRLAERPGTPAEGKVAKAMLKRHKREQPKGVKEQYELTGFVFEFTATNPTPEQTAKAFRDLCSMFDRWRQS